VVITNYRLSPKVKHPAHVEDVAAAFAWAHKNIARHGGRADELFLCGHSAGGHLAALLATNESYLAAEKLSFTAVKGVLALSGVYSILPGVLPAQFGDDPEVCQQASPLSNVKGKHPPFFIAYADKDMPFLGPMAEQMVKALKKAECPVELVKMKNRTHVTIIKDLGTNKEDDPLSQAMLGFIAKHSGLKLPVRKAG